MSVRDDFYTHLSECPICSDDGDEGPVFCQEGSALLRAVAMDGMTGNIEAWQQGVGKDERESLAGGGGRWT